MPTATVRWVTQQQFVGMDGGRHAVVLSGDDKAQGMRPSELLLTALAGCSAVDVVAIMKKKRKPLCFLEVAVDAQRDPDPPWPYRRIHLTYTVAGPNLTQKAVEQAVSLSMEKYCSVAATVRGVADITTAIEILAEADHDARAI